MRTYWNTRADHTAPPNTQMELTTGRCASWPPLRVGLAGHPNGVGRLGHRATERSLGPPCDVRYRPLEARWSRPGGAARMNSENSRLPAQVRLGRLFEVWGELA